MTLSILSNLIADAIVLLLAVGGTALFYRLFRRRALVGFFGVESDRKFRIYISHLSIIPPIHPDGVERPFHGSTVGFPETNEARKIADLFLFLVPGFSTVSTVLGRLFFADIEVNIEPAPFPPSEPDLSRSYVSLGSSKFNSASKFIETKVRTDLGFRGEDNAELHIPGLSPIRKDIATWNAFIARMTYNGLKLFYVAGFHDIGTAGAAFYLHRNWHFLHKKFRQSDFCVLLNLPTADYRLAHVVAENTLTSQPR